MTQTGTAGQTEIILSTKQGKDTSVYERVYEKIQSVKEGSQERRLICLHISSNPYRKYTQSPLI